MALSRALPMRCIAWPTAVLRHLGRGQATSSAVTPTTTPTAMPQRNPFLHILLSLLCPTPSVSPGLWGKYGGGVAKFRRREYNKNCRKFLRNFPTKGLQSAARIILSQGGKIPHLQPERYFSPCTCHGEK